MKTVSRKLRSPLKMHGGKSYLARRIVALFPEHSTYVEPFAGGLSVLLNKPRAEREVVGDKNLDLCRFWWTVQNRSEELIERIREIPYSLDSWLEWNYHERWGHVSQAAQFLVCNRFSRGGMGKTFAWSDRLRGGQPGDVNAWQTIQQEMPAIAERFKGVELHGDCCTAIEQIKDNDSPSTLIYCDPPYLHETRTAKRAYDHEMTTEEHAELLEALKACAGKVFLSGYRSGLYDEALVGWKRHEWELPNHSGQGDTKQRRVECLWESP